MTFAGDDFLPLDTQKNLPLTHNLGDAFAQVLKRLYPYHTAKRFSADYDFDASTAKNGVKGVAGATVITKTIHRRQAKHKDAWAMWIALGELVIGEKLTEYERRRIKSIIEIQESAREALQELDRSADLLESRASSLVDLGARLGSGSGR